MLHNCSLQKTAEVFFKEPTRKHYLMEISRKINLAHTAVKANLVKLKELKIIKESIEQRGSRTFPLYQANIENKNYIENKISYNIESTRFLATFLNDKLTPKSIVLFGSYSRGEDIESSDIDIFIEQEQTKVHLSEFEKILNRKIELHFQKSFDSYPEDLKNNIANGIVLKGFLEVYSDSQSKTRNG